LVPSFGAFDDFLRFKLTRIEAVAQVTISVALRPVTYQSYCFKV